MNYKKFTPINDPGLYGYRGIRPDGFTVEYVRCYAGEWAVFTYLDGRMTDHCRQGLFANDGRPQLHNLSYQKACEWAHKLYREAK